MPHPMANTKLLLEKRSNLESLLEDLNPRGKPLELNVYDLMVKSRMDYHTRMDGDLDEIDAKEKSSLKPKIESLIDEYGHKPAYIFLLNFDQYNETHRKHIFDGVHRRECIGKHISEKSVIPEILKIAYEDNAVILDSKGFIYATNVQLVDVNPSAIINSNDEEISHKMFGFHKEVHTRHYSSIGASFHMKGLVVYTLGEGGDV